MKKKDEMEEGKSLPHKYLQGVINKSKQKFDLDEDVIISHQVIYSRIWRKNLFCDERGPKTPMTGIENIVLVIAQQKARMNQPLSPKEGLELANSLVSDTPVEDAIKKYYIYKKIFGEGENVQLGNLIK